MSTRRRIPILASSAEAGLTRCRRLHQPHPSSHQLHPEPIIIMLAMGHPQLCSASRRRKTKALLYAARKADFKSQVIYCHNISWHVCFRARPVAAFQTLKNRTSKAVNRHWETSKKQKNDRFNTTKPPMLCCVFMVGLGYQFSCGTIAGKER